MVRHGVIYNTREMGNFETSGIYRGVRLDANCVFRPKYENEPDPPDPDLVVTHKEEILTVCYGIIDFPFSLIADTLILPYDLTTINKENPN